MWHERTSPLDPSSLNRIWRRKKGGKKKKNTNFKERVSNFSLDFPAIGPLVSGQAKSKVAPHGKSYAWASVLWSFDNSGR